MYIPVLGVCVRDFGFRVGVLLEAAEWGVLVDCVLRYHDFD